MHTLRQTRKYKCCWSSTLSSGQAPGFEWQGSVHSDWPHSSLSPPSSTGLQWGSGSCSSCSGRPSPGPPRCGTPPRTCWCPPPSSPDSRLRGSPRWPHTPVWHCSAAAPLWRGGGRSGWDASHPLEERHKHKGVRMKAANKGRWHFYYFIHQPQQLVLLLDSEISQYQTISLMIQVEMSVKHQFILIIDDVFISVSQCVTVNNSSLGWFFIFKLTELKHSCEHS